MADDFYSRAWQHQMALLDAQKAANLADLQSHRVNGDVEAAGAVELELANTEAARANLVALHNQYIQSQQPPPPESAEVKAAKPIGQMTYADIYEMSAGGSKLGVDPDAFQRGIAEVQRRRARGE
jgi:hypothetical protein